MHRSVREGFIQNKKMVVNKVHSDTLKVHSDTLKYTQGTLRYTQVHSRYTKVHSDILNYTE